MTAPITLDVAQRLANAWAARLGMAHWEIDVYVNTSDNDDWSMRSYSQDNYDRGSIEIHPRSLGLTEPAPMASNFDHDIATNPARFEKLIVHEMLHLLFRRRDRAHKRMMDQIPFEARSAFDVLFEDADEEIVEIIARALVRHGSLFNEVLPQQAMDASVFLRPA